ncbi:GIY-YIG nuclease family protein [Flavihumibacter fluvii]|uniref:GIY-YIG nuclease family protein n=1 Tax=Flavihumibacter fluvii TaxID=2838157 RepID=UPI001BDED48E|nr:hypothetical protein [Flavihumibacter fluvii]ULQ51700.1 hypothetical protein KJS93_16550 [Flavihumibacter fluvii]
MRHALGQFQISNLEMTEYIAKSFMKTKQNLNGHKNYPTKPGIYAFTLADNSTLEDFGKAGQIIYIGIAKYSLSDRDFKQHFKSGKTGSSTLRRSIGAALKTKLKLKAIPRGGENDSKRFENYKFAEEQTLTDWMVSNLEIGYWTPDEPVSYQQLRDIEKDITLVLKPTLDLDNRTRRFNPLAEKLDELRNICRAEARKHNYGKPDGNR